VAILVDPDVTIAGGGIAGCALASTLAREGLGVVVLERQEGYADRVRGEGIHPWGVAEAQWLGLYEVLVGSGGHVVERVVGYRPDRDPADAQADEGGRTDGLIDGVPGRLNVGHPAMCEALAARAEVDGAVVLRGVTHVEVTTGPRPAVSFRHRGSTRQAACRLVVGADGRSSRVRRQVGIELQRAAEPHMIAGLLVDDLDIEDRFDVVGMGVEAWNVTFPQGSGRARVYLCWDPEDRQRFAGPDGTARFLSACVVDGAPRPEAWAEATPSGPCRTYPGDDTWTEQPFAEGVVLIGDAAGHNNPLIGQGLALAFRDVRDVSEVLLNGRTWSSEAFVRYGSQRAERLRRMRFVAQLSATVSTTFGPEGEELRRNVRRRVQEDASLAAPFRAVWLGPDALDPEVCTEEFRRRFLGVG
jgi:menaquinone-9 beta-reductase